MPNLSYSMQKLEIDHVDFIYCNAVNNLYLAAVHHTLVLKGYYMYKVTKNLTVTNSDRKSMPSTSCIILFFYQDILLRVRLEVISI